MPIQRHLKRQDSIVLQFVALSLLCTLTTSSRLLSDDASFVCHILSILFSDKRPQLVKWASWPPTTVKSLID